MVTFLIIASILIVSGFGIFNILMIIYEKMPDIAILKAIGLQGPGHTPIVPDRITR